MSTGHSSLTLQLVSLCQIDHHIDKGTHGVHTEDNGFIEVELAEGTEMADSRAKKDEASSYS